MKQRKTFWVGEGLQTTQAKGNAFIVGVSISNNYDIFKLHFSQQLSAGDDLKLCKRAV